MPIINCLLDSCSQRKRSNRQRGRWVDIPFASSYFTVMTCVGAFHVGLGTFIITAARAGRGRVNRTPLCASVGRRISATQPRRQAAGTPEGSHDEGGETSDTRPAPDGESVEISGDSGRVSDASSVGTSPIPSWSSADIRRGLPLVHAECTALTLDQVREAHSRSASATQSDQQGSAARAFPCSHSSRQLPRRPLPEPRFAWVFWRVRTLSRKPSSCTDSPSSPLGVSGPHPARAARYTRESLCWVEA